ncbi:MAG: response regulator transcription factor, partial [Chloroflexi bacterium]
HPQELVARAKALLRRAKIEPDQPKLIRAGKLEVDLERHEIRHGKAKVQLRPKEFDLLALLARHPGRVFQRSELLDLVWGYDFPGYTRTVDVHVQQVREKLAAAEITDPSIQTVWGVGYRLELAGSGS